LISLAWFSVVGRKKLIVHLVPHSHNDAGWIQTFESYYQSSTSKTITNVVEVLVKDKSKIFHWSDIAFFHRWWSDQTHSTREQVKILVRENRFIFIGGGWIMNDEALPTYKEAMLQMRLGLDFLQNTFGVRPSIGWQIDPFGSSSVTVAILRKLGYDALVENRVSNNFKDKMRHRDGYNFYWQGHTVDQNSDDDIILTHILQYFYIFPQTRFDRQFLYKNMGSYSAVFFREEVQPVIDEINT